MNDLGVKLFKEMATPGVGDMITEIMEAEKIMVDGKLSPPFYTLIKSHMVQGGGTASALFTATSAFLQNYDFIIVAMIGDFIAKHMIMKHPSLAPEFTGLTFTVLKED